MRERSGGRGWGGRKEGKEGEKEREERGDEGKDGEKENVQYFISDVCSRCKNDGLHDIIALLREEHVLVVRRGDE